MKKILYLSLITAIITAITSCGGDTPTAVSGISQNQDNIKNENSITSNLPIFNSTDKFYNYDMSDYYQIYVPYGVRGDGMVTVNYKDTNRLKQLWLAQINREAVNDGKVFAIRNKANNRDANNFQKKHTHGNHSAQDYYYFNKNGDIVWKEDNRVIKKFVGAIITGYRDIEKRDFGRGWPGKPKSYAIVTYIWKQRGVYTVGAIYANTLTTDKAREIYFGRKKTGGTEDFQMGEDPFKDGVYDFVAARYTVETYNDGINFAANLFERQYINPGFIEVLVMYPYDNMGYSGAAGVHSYYAYHGIYDMWEEYKNHPGIYFTPQNMPYMTNQNLYLGKRPEDTTPLLTHPTAFTDEPRGWCYLFMPGHKN